jgi:TfoX/Sxy family transcriptional regulator of competence genes
MAYDEGLADRVRNAVASKGNISERRMFGGLCLMLNGNMFAGVMQDELMLRVGPERFEAALARPGARPMDFTGRSMAGYIYVAAPALTQTASLTSWLDEALGFVETLPVKDAAKPGKMKR